MSLSNQKCKTQPTMINLHPNEYIQELHYYPFKVNVDICVGSCNTLNDLSNKVCVPNKTEDLNLKHVQHDCRNKWIKNTYHANVNINLMVESLIQIKSEITINFNASAKNIIHVKTIIFGIMLPVITKMVNI